MLWSCVPGWHVALATWPKHKTAQRPAERLAVTNNAFHELGAADRGITGKGTTGFLLLFDLLTSPKASVPSANSRKKRGIPFLVIGLI